MQELIHQKKKLFASLTAVLIFLFFVLSISSLVDVFNKIKQNKYIGQDVEHKNTITVSEAGEVSATPDLAVISLIVTNEAKTVSQAMTENTSRMNKVIEAVKNQGVEEKDLKTISYNIYPRYEYERNEFGYQTGKRILAGYEIYQALQVKIRDLEEIGTIIERGTAAGANEVGSLSFTIDNQDELKKQARKQAIAKAKTKAKEMAQDVGVKLGKITGFSENYYVPYYGARDLAMAEGLGGGGIPDIQTGENKISVTVVITYEIY